MGLGGVLEGGSVDHQYCIRGAPPARASDGLHVFAVSKTLNHKITIHVFRSAFTSAHAGYTSVQRWNLRLVGGG